MPARNIVKQYVANSYYHVYNRGVERRVIFIDDQDYTYLIKLFSRYLSPGPQFNNSGERVETLYGDIELLAFCLMPNHFHLFIYQTNPSAIQKLLQKISTGYAMYFNQKYDRVGSLFQNKYKAALIDSDSYLSHISRYIHLNPLDLGEDFKSYRYSSIEYYRSHSDRPSWINPDRVLSLFDSSWEAYRVFLEDYAEYRLVADGLEKVMA